jgi:hypothetical protein
MKTPWRVSAITLACPLQLQASPFSPHKNTSHCAQNNNCTRLMCRSVLKKKKKKKNESSDTLRSVSIAPQWQQKLSALARVLS